MDRSASACTDFYQYACGRWVADTVLPSDRVRLVRGESELRDRNARRLRRLLEDAGAGNVDPSDRFERKAGDFYAACMDEVDVEARGLAELQAEWAEVDAAGDLGALWDVLARMEALGVEVPFRFGALPLADNPTVALLVISPGRLALPEAALAAGAEASAPYVEVVRRLLQDAGESAADALEDAEGVRELEAVLLLGRLKREEALVAARLHSRVDRDGLAALSPNVPWERFLRGVGAASLEAFGVADPAYLSRVGQLLGEVPLSRWKSYLRFRLEEQMARDSALPSTLVEDRAELERLSGGSALEKRARWEACVDATVRVFGAGVGEAFGRKYLGREGREGASALLSALRRSLLQRVGALTFMDAATRTRAVSKLDRMTVLVGYGGEVPDYGAIRVQRDTYFRDLLSARRFLLAQEVARAGRGVIAANGCSGRPG